MRVTNNNIVQVTGYCRCLKTIAASDYVPTEKGIHYVQLTYN
ncbi:21605_t:CDS:2 [Cetraspora pellucida]|uniref:21605_t:CDS:1 n=1 Tax=Cetraspora pellucida TaxID=1433469 RepID=A0A9N9JHN6_9GLOM|nr:21605_t:CDS:2 [Cetraspora pellucida]